MTTRKPVSRVLIAFAVVSVAFFAFRSVRAAREWRPPSSLQATPASNVATPPAQRLEAGSKVIAYYFHVNVRCTTCRLIEAYARQVVQQRFKEDIAAGRLEWRLVNIQNPENRHFIKDYKLFTRSLVLVRIRDGRQEELQSSERHVGAGRTAGTDAAVC